MISTLLCLATRCGLGQSALRRPAGADPKYARMSPATERAWTGTNRFLEALWPDESLTLYKSTFTNSQPDLTVSTVDYVSTMTGTAPFLVGLTVE